MIKSNFRNCFEQNACKSTFKIKFANLALNANIYEEKFFFCR